MQRLQKRWRAPGEHVTRMTTSAPATPARVTLEVQGRTLVFVQVEATRYRAELDGTPQPIHGQRHLGTASPSGGTSRVSPAPVADTVDLAVLLRCRALGAAPTPFSNGIALDACDNWGHFRQSTLLRVVIRCDASGVEYTTHIKEQDESWY